MKTGKSLKNMLGELEGIIEQMEKEDLEIEDMIALYEKGSKLSQECQETIKKAENKINIIQNKDNEK
tara:strand:- start:156 stop:356 length:201 start_codon:yes stop_codon:yes gene_type:complete